MIQDMTFQRIIARQVSSNGLEGPPEQETDMTKDKTQANDTWAQNAAHQHKGKAGWPHWVAGQPPGRPTAQWAPLPYSFDVAAS